LAYLKVVVALFVVVVTLVVSVKEGFVVVTGVGVSMVKSVSCKILRLSCCYSTLNFSPTFLNSFKNWASPTPLKAVAKNS
jgi:hypothetical protein